jgi:hypothetical protein
MGGAPCAHEPKKQKRHILGTGFREMWHGEAFRADPHDRVRAPAYGYWTGKFAGIGAG